jgi:hypothetical protein
MTVTQGDTPLGAVLDRMDRAVGADRTIYVVNLFDSAHLPEVTARTQEAPVRQQNSEDVKMLHRIDEVADLMQALENLPEGKLLKEPFDSVSPIP